MSLTILTMETLNQKVSNPGHHASLIETIGLGCAYKDAVERTMITPIFFLVDKTACHSRIKGTVSRVKSVNILLNPVK